MMRNLKVAIGALTVGLGLLAATPLQAGGIDDFQLARAIPADVALVVLTRDHEGLSFLHQQFDRVWQVAERQHFERDLRTLLKGLAQQGTEELSEEEKTRRVEEFDQRWQQFSDLLAGVEWSSLFSQEMAFASKLSFPAPEFVLLGRAPVEKAAANFAGLEKLLKALIQLAPEGMLSLSTQGSGDSVVHTVAITPAPLPFGLMLARHKDVLMLGFGQVLPEQSLALLRGENGQTVASTERFQAALRRLPAPKDMIFFVDLARLIGQLRSYADSVLGMIPTTEEADPKIKALPGRLIDGLDLAEYAAGVSTTDGLKTSADTVVVLRPEARGKTLYNVFFRSEALREPLRYVPREAQNFTVWSGLDWQALYDGIIRFIRQDVPDGQQLLEQWEQTRSTMPVDIEKDILSWLGSAYTSFSLPPRSAYQPGQWVMMLAVKDEQKARQVLQKLWETLEPLLAQQGGSLKDAEIAGTDGFKTIVHPMLAMVAAAGQPTIGVHNGQLIVGSGAKVIEAALATASGQAPNFSENERFQKEGLPLTGPVIAASFADMTRYGEEVGQMLMMIPMIGMMAPDLNRHPAGRALISAAGKAGKVVRELNFFQSSCSVTTFDGQVLYTKSLTNYREPPKPETAPATEPAAKPKGP
jgi:hypothetical protein